MRIARIEPIRLKTHRRRGDPEQWALSHSPACVSLHTLNKCTNIEDMRSDVLKYMSPMPSGACFAAIVRVGDSGQELAEHLTRSGANFTSTNLTNNEIVMLRPNSMLLFESVAIYSGNELSEITKVSEFTKEVFIYSEIGTPFESVLPKRFATKLLDAVLVWTKP